MFDEQVKSTRLTLRWHMKSMFCIQKHPQDKRHSETSEYTENLQTADQTLATIKSQNQIAFQGLPMSSSLTYTTIYAVSTTSAGPTA